MSSTHSWFVAVGAALAFAAPTSAQQNGPTDANLVPAVSQVQVAAPTPATALRPTAESVALNARLTPVTVHDPAAALMPLPAEGPQSTNVALMIVGGAGMIVGSIIGGDTGTIVMVGGGVVGLIGLWRYLR
jgi:hypothetical protein